MIMAMLAHAFLAVVRTDEHARHPDSDELIPLPEVTGTNTAESPGIDSRPASLSRAMVTVMTMRKGYAA